MINKARKWSRLGGVGSAVIALVALGVMTGAQSASAGNSKGLPRAYHPETIPGFTNTFTPAPAVLSPKCPQSIVDTPGSFPATKTLNSSLNTASSFYVGGKVHYIYHDNPHGSAFNFTIQDCEVAYPTNFFTASDFNRMTGVLTNPTFTKQMLDKNGTEVDGAALSGISNPEGLIYFSWTVQPEPVGTWMCNFARDIRASHGGSGNRKAIPTCFQVTSPPITFLGYTDSFRSTPGPTTPTLSGGMNNPHGVPVTFVGCGASQRPDVLRRCRLRRGHDPVRQPEHDGDHDRPDQQLVGGHRPVRLHPLERPAQPGGTCGWDADPVRNGRHATGWLRRRRAGRERQLRHLGS